MWSCAAARAFTALVVSQPYVGDVTADFFAQSWHERVMPWQRDQGILNEYEIWKQYRPQDREGFKPHRGKVTIEDFETVGPDK